MKRVTAILLITVASVVYSAPLEAGTQWHPLDQRTAEKQAEKQRKAAEKQFKKQQKLLVKQMKAQQKAIKKARKRAQKQAAHPKW